MWMHGEFMSECISALFLSSYRTPILLMHLCVAADVFTAGGAHTHMCGCTVSIRCHKQVVPPLTFLASLSVCKSNYTLLSELMTSRWGVGGERAPCFTSVKMIPCAALSSLCLCLKLERACVSRGGMSIVTSAPWLLEMTWSNSGASVLLLVHQRGCFPVSWTPESYFTRANLVRRAQSDPSGFYWNISEKVRSNLFSACVMSCFMDTKMRMKTANRLILQM